MMYLILVSSFAMAGNEVAILLARIVLWLRNSRKACRIVVGGSFWSVVGVLHGRQEMCDFIYYLYVVGEGVLFSLGLPSMA